MSARRERDGEPPFFVRGRQSLPDLERWLKGRKFNCAGHFSNDKKGNPMISVGWDWHPEKDNGPLPEKRGLIIVLDRNLTQEVERLAQRMAGYPPP